MNSTENKNSQKKGGMKPVIIIGALVIVALVVVIVVLLKQKNAQNEQKEEKRDVIVTQDNVEEIIEQMDTEEFMEPGYYTVTMNNDWHFANGTAASDNAHVENVPENTNDVYFDLFLAGDEENAIYKSPVIPRGGTLENITLDTPLDAGSYDCVMVYHLVDENQETVSTLRVTVTLNIEG